MNRIIGSIVLAGCLAGCMSLKPEIKPEFGAAPAQVQAVQQTQSNYAAEFAQYQLANTLLNVCIDILKAESVWPTDRLEQVRLTREYTDQIVAMLDANLSEAEIISVFEQTAQAGK